MPTRLNDIETTFRLKVDDALRGFDRISKAAEKTERSLESIASASTRIGIGFAAFGAAVTTALGFAVRGAEEEAQALRELEGVVNSTGASFDQNRARIDTFVQGLARATKFTDDQIIPALNRAVLATNDLDKGFRAAELGVKLAAAGFGNVEQNAGIVARVLEGQVRAIGRLIPEFRDLEERLEAGASEADLAAEALLRLQNIADNIEPPSNIQLFTKQIGELKDAVGLAVIEALAPFIPKLIELAEAFTRFAETGPGKAVIALTAFAGIISAVGGALLIFAGQVALASAALFPGGLAAATAGVTGALSKLGILLSPGGLVLTALAALAIFVGKSVIELNKLSKASDEALDKAFKAPLIAQFTAEMNALRSVLAGLEAGTLSAADAQKEFNRLGLQNEEQARDRIVALDGIVNRLKEEKKALEGTAATDKETTDEKTENINQIIAKMEEERQKAIQIDIAKEQLAEKDRKRGEELLRQAGLLETPRAPVEPAIPQLPEQEVPQDLGFITEGVEGTSEELDRINEKVQTLVDQEPGVFGLFGQFKTGADQIAFAEERARAFGAFLEDMLASAIDGFATLVVNLGSDLATNFENAGKNAAKFFRQLIGDLIRAIAKALILESIIGAFGGGGGFVGRALGRLFQDPQADQLARFEGARFSDLFFQGMFREFNTSQERMESALTQNRDIVRSNSKSMTAIVNEATPETTVEFTDRHVEPRVRQRANQRSSRGTLTNAERDRQIESINERLDALGAA